MSKRLFLISSLALALCFTCLEFNIYALIFLIIIQVRIFFTRNIGLIVLEILFCILFGIYVSYFNACMNRNYFPNVSTEGTLFVQPDDIDVDGDLLKMVGDFQHRKVSAYYTLKNNQEANRFKYCTEPLKIKLIGKIKKIDIPTNENQFNNAKFQKTKGILNSIYIQKMEASNKKVGFKDLTHILRKKLKIAFEKLFKPLAYYAQMIIIGYNPKEFNQTISSIKKLGIIYIFCLSGMHVFYLVKTFRIITKFLRITYESTNILLLIVLPIYACLGGNSTGLSRAVWMAVVMIVGQIFNFKIQGLDAWLVVLLFNLFLNPWIVFSMGAQLSYLLTLVLLLSKKDNFFKLSFKLNGYSLPIILWNTYQWNLLTTLLSLVIIPCFEFIILPVTFLGVYFRFLETFSNDILGFISELFNYLSNLNTVITFGKPNLGVIFCGITLMFLLEKYGLNILWFLGILYLSSFLQIHYFNCDEIVYLDIGQGDCTLIRTKFNKNITLIDTGGKVSFQKFKWQTRHSHTTGETIVANYLLSKGVDRIDQLVLTHQDSDHVGNFPSVSQLVKVKRVFVPLGMEKLKSFNKRLSKSKISIDRVKGITNKNTQKLKYFQVLHPFNKGMGKNEDSIVLYYKFHGIKCLFTGDLDQNGELKLIEKYPSLKIDILKAGHHGSKTSSAFNFVKQISPKLAMISAGRNNRYGHPNHETLATFRKLNIASLNTADYGMLKLEFKNNTVILKKYLESGKYENN